MTDDGFPEELDRKERRQPSLVFQHLTLVATVAAFAFVALRVGRIAGSDPGTTLTVLNAAGVASVLVGTFITFLPTIAIIGILFMLGATRRPGATDDQKRAIWAVLGLVLLVATVLLPIYAAAIIWLALIAFVGLTLWFRKRGTEDRHTLYGLVDWTSVAAGIIVSLFISTDMWLPAEIVTLDSARGEVVFVLSSETDWTTLLLDEGRTIQIVRTDDVEARVVCNLGGRGLRRSLADLLDEDDSATDNPACPTPEVPDPPESSQ